MVDVTPAQPAQVLDASSSRFPHDALVQVEGATSRSHEGSKPGSMDGVGHCGTPDGVAPIVLDTTSCDPLAMAASPSMTVAATEHPLSPDVSLASNDRTSYFRAAILPGISPVSDVIFPEENEDTPDAEGLDKQADAQRSIAGLNARKASHPLKSQDEASGVETSLPASIRLPRAPHNLSAAAVDEHLRSALPSDLRGVLLAQELSRQLERAEIELRQLRSLQEARENSLIALLRETGSVSESLISRTLVRSNAEARETLGDKQSDNNGWKVTLSASNRDSVSERTPATRVSLM